MQTEIHSNSTHFEFDGILSRTASVDFSVPSRCATEMLATIGSPELIDQCVRQTPHTHTGHHCHRALDGSLFCYAIFSTYLVSITAQNSDMFCGKWALSNLRYGEYVIAEWFPKLIQFGKRKYFFSSPA